MMHMSPTDAQIILNGAEASGEALGIGYRRALETIANMREEWGVSWDEDPSGNSRDWGFATRAAAERWEKANRHYGPGRGHAVRRYVTDGEDA